MINQDGTKKVRYILSMQVCSTTKKVLKCQHDSESDEFYNVDVSSSIGKTGDIPYSSDGFALYHKWMNKSFVEVEEDGSLSDREEGHWFQGRPTRVGSP